MSILTAITSVINPVTKLIDKMHTSEDEKLEAKRLLKIIENQWKEKVLEYEGDLLKARTSIIVAEAQGSSWIQRNWRPITMLTFLFLVVMDAFGFLPFRLADDAWGLLKIGLGGYVIGRSAEKVTPNIVAALKK